MRIRLQPCICVQNPPLALTPDNSHVRDGLNCYKHLPEYPLTHAPASTCRCQYQPRVSRSLHRGRYLSCAAGSPVSCCQHKPRVRTRHAGRESTRPTPGARTTQTCQCQRLSTVRWRALIATCLRAACSCGMRPIGNATPQSRRTHPKHALGHGAKCRMSLAHTRGKRHTPGHGLALGIKPERASADDVVYPRDALRSPM